MRTLHVTPVAFVILDPDTRRRHLYVVGQTSTGKSTLLLSLIAQDLAAGRGLAVLDLHGDLPDRAVARAAKPEQRDIGAPMRS